MSNHRFLFIILLVLMWGALMYLFIDVFFQKIERQQNTQSVVKVPSFYGETRFPAVRKPPEPQGEFKTGVYLKFNSAKYTDSEGKIFVPTDEVLQGMTFPELEELYYRNIENIQILCPRSRHIGDEDDGGYHICETVLPYECLAYSFGNRRDYTFDDGLAAYYNCEVHSFDPYDEQPNHQHGELVTFHKLGIGAKDIINDQLSIRTLNSTISFLGHAQRPLDLLKIDVESVELEALPQILESKILDKSHVKLLIIEFHLNSRFFNWRNATDLYMSALRSFRGLYDIGFRTYFFRMWTFYCLDKDQATNNTRANCHEVHFMRE